MTGQSILDDALRLRDLPVSVIPIAANKKPPSGFKWKPLQSKIADESEVKILGRSRSTGDLVPSTGEHVSGEFPLTVPARRKVHFALVWTANREIDPALTQEFVSNLDVKSFVVLDEVRRYRIECPASP